MWVWPILARGIVAYLIMRSTVQLTGVQRAREANLLELAIVVSLAALAAFGALGPDPGLGVIAVVYALWVGLWLAERYLSVRSRQFRRQTVVDPAVLVYHGKILEHNLHRRRWTTEQLLSRLRARDAFRLADVEMAILEPDGALSVMRTPQSEPLTKQDMLVAGRHYGLPVELIVEGQILHQNLDRRHLSEKWLRDHLRAFGVEFASEVALATVDDNDELYVDKYDDRLDRQPGLHPHHRTSQRNLADQQQQCLREKPISQPEQALAERQLQQALRDSLPDVPQKK